MATDADFVKFIVDQLAGIDRFLARKCLGSMQSIAEEKLSPLCVTISFL